MNERPPEVGDLRLATIVMSATDGSLHPERDQHIDRLVRLGAARVEDWPYPVQHDFVVLRDPDGNEFRVIHQAA